MQYAYSHCQSVIYCFQTKENAELKIKSQDRALTKRKLSLVVQELYDNKFELSALYSMSNTLKNIATCSQEKLCTPEDIKTEACLTVTHWIRTVCII